MEGLMYFGLFVAALVILDVLALRFGVDSRPGSTDLRQSAVSLDVF
jgi:hypothetical protein